MGLIRGGLLTICSSRVGVIRGGFQEGANSLIYGSSFKHVNHKWSDLLEDTPRANSGIPHCLFDRILSHITDNHF